MILAQLLTFIYSDIYVIKSSIDATMNARQLSSHMRQMNQSINPLTGEVSLDEETY